MYHLASNTGHVQCMQLLATNTIDVRLHSLLTDGLQCSEQTVGLMQRGPYYR